MESNNKRIYVEEMKMYMKRSSMKEKTDVS